jgi:hypothetical protein
MFRKYLKKDLFGIFEIEQIDFANTPAHFNSELKMLSVVVDQDGIRTIPRQGEIYFSVVGTIEFVQDQTQTNFGFFAQRMMLSQFKTKGTFRLLDKESNETLASDSNNDADRILVKKSQKFSYRISIPFNPAIGEIEDYENGQVSMV